MYHPYLMLAMAEGTGEKAAAAQQRRHWSFAALRRIGAALRLAEILLAVALLSWSSSRIPAAVRLSSVFLRRLSDLLLSTPFVFLLGNAIVITLLARSRNLPSSPPPSAAPSLYDELLRHSAEIGARRDAREEVVYEDKAVCLVETRAGEYRRSRSDAAEAFKAPRLRRTATDVGAEAETEQEEGEEEEEEKETMSDEELRARVEAFIAKQLKFHRAECVAMVPAGHLTAE